MGSVFPGSAAIGVQHGVKILTIILSAHFGGLAGLSAIPTPSRPLAGTAHTTLRSQIRPAPDQSMKKPFRQGHRLLTKARKCKIVRVRGRFYDIISKKNCPSLLTKA